MPRHNRQGCACVLFFTCMAARSCTQRPARQYCTRTPAEGSTAQRLTAVRLSPNIPLPTDQINHLLTLTHPAPGLGSYCCDVVTTVSVIKCANPHSRCIGAPISARAWHCNYTACSSGHTTSALQKNLHAATWCRSTPSKTTHTRDGAWTARTHTSITTKNRSCREHRSTSDTHRQCAEAQQYLLLCECSACCLLLAGACKQHKPAMRCALQLRSTAALITALRNCSLLSPQAVGSVWICTAAAA